MDLSVFERGVRRQRRMIVAVFGPLMTLLAVVFVNLPPPVSGLPLGPIIAVLCLAVVGIAVWDWRRPIERSRGIRVLRNSPEDVVWFYPRRHIRQGRHVASGMMLRLANGKTIEIPIIPMQEEAACIAMLRAALPRACAGYDGALEARFKSDPRSLLRPA